MTSPNNIVLRAFQKCIFFVHANLFLYFWMFSNIQEYKNKSAWTKIIHFWKARKNSHNDRKQQRYLKIPLLVSVIVRRFRISNIKRDIKKYIVIINTISWPFHIYAFTNVNSYLQTIELQTHSIFNANFKIQNANWTKMQWFFGKYFHHTIVILERQTPAQIETSRLALQVICIENMSRVDDSKMVEGDSPYSNPTRIELAESNTNWTE